MTIKKDFKNIDNCLDSFIDEAIYNYETGKDWNIKTVLGKSSIRIVIVYPENVVLAGKKQLSFRFYLPDHVASSSTVEYNGIKRELTGTVFTNKPLIALARIKQIQKALKNKFGKSIYVNIPIYDLAGTPFYAFSGSPVSSPVYRVKQGKRKEAQ